MSEQSAHQQQEFDSDQHVYYFNLHFKGEAYENYRLNCTGRIQCRN